MDRIGLSAFGGIAGDLFWRDRYMRVFVAHNRFIDRDFEDQLVHPRP